MSRRFLLPWLVVGLLAGNPAAGSAASVDMAMTPGVSVIVPARVTPGRSTAVVLRMPPSVAAVEGRVFVNDAAAEVVGVAPLGPGTATRPVREGAGSAFAAYGLQAVKGHTTVRIVLYPRTAGRLQVRVAIDALADRAGHRIRTGRGAHLSTLAVGARTGTFLAPAATPGPAPTRLARPARDFVRDGTINAQDLDTVRSTWYAAHERGTVCGSQLQGDANADGCVDVVDLQVELAAMGQVTPAAAVAAANHTFIVDSAADTPDATNGDGICADTLGRCTLRAAMTEADWVPGDDRIEFNLAGTAPVTIQLTSRLPDISSRAGTLTIDGYTQPGSRVNTASLGSNATMGVEIRGNGKAAKETAFYITSAGNTIRGLLINNIYNGIFLDRSGAHDNKIIGNWIGYNRNGSQAAFANFGVTYNMGANHNVTGTPDLADRNVIGAFKHAEESYGPGTDFNVTQNNLFCLGPTGLTTATCNTASDHNFGPKNHLIGGMGQNQKNVFGPTTLQGVEFSHGWNPSTHDYSSPYAINGNRVIGNWIGFRGDGSYAAAFRSGLDYSPSDNGQGVNCYDGSNENVIDSNYVGSVYDGIQVESPNALNNVVRNNVIGVSPAGEAAPMSGWGLKIRWGAQNVNVEGNTIRNAGAGGIGLLDTTNTGAATSVAYNVRISRNIISNTPGPAIGLFGDANDNSHLGPPVLSSAQTRTVSGSALAGVSVELFRASRPVGQTGLPIEFLGSATAGPDRTWSIPVALAVGDVVTALQIRPDGNTSQLAANVAVTTAPVNRAPVFNADLPDRADREGDAVRFSAAATDADGDTLTYSATGLPAGVSIEPASGLISGTLTYASSGSHAVEVSVTDGMAVTTDTFTWTVADVNRPPTASVALSPRKPGTNATLTAAATTSDPDGDPVSLTFTWSVNGSVVRTFTSATALTDTLDLSRPGNGDVGDVVRVDVTPSDGTLEGTPATDQISVTAPVVYASDGFDRTVTNGWGTADTGGAYTTLSTAADYGVSGSAGTIRVAAGATRASILGSVSQADVELSLRFAINKLPVGGQAYAYGVVRRVSTTSEYRARVRITSAGAVYLQATAFVSGVETSLGREVLVGSLTATPGAFVWLRVQVVGVNPTTIGIRAWADGTAEPTTWQYSTTNTAASLQAAGEVGVRAYISSASTNGAVVFYFDDLRATPIP